MVCPVRSSLSTALVRLAVRWIADVVRLTGTGFRAASRQRLCRRTDGHDMAMGWQRQGIFCHVEVSVIWAICAIPKMEGGRVDRPLASADPFLQDWPTCSLHHIDPAVRRRVALHAIQGHPDHIDLFPCEKRRHRHATIDGCPRCSPTGSGPQADGLTGCRVPCPGPIEKIKLFGCNDSGRFAGMARVHCSSVIA